MISLNNILATIGFVVTVALAQIAPAVAAPNIVLFIADDMGWGDVGYHGSEIRTPEIDRLAAGGAKLERFYVQAVCSPTRAALMTGRSPLTTGVAAPFNPWHATGLAVDEKLLPEYLREAGYRTHAVGKWHLGPNEAQYHPLKRGFDSFYGSLHGYMSYDSRMAFGRLDWQRDGETVYEDGYSTSLIGAEAERVIRERDPDRPFFLYVTFNAPHTPLQAPDAAIAEYAHIEDANRRVYAAMVSEMDRAIAGVTSTLDEEQISDNTLVMFFTDNGGVPELGARNEPLRGGVLQHAYFTDEWKLVQGRNAEGQIQNFLFEIMIDPYEQYDLADQYPNVLDRLVAELDAMPKAEPLSINEPPPAFNAPGAPNSIAPDDRAPGGTPYAESGPTPYPPGNYPATD